MTYFLDLNSLPGDEAFEGRPILIGPPHELRSRLASMPKTLERVEGAIMFAAQSSKQSEPWRVAAFLRAALADFCSIEEMQKLECGKGRHFRIESSANPLLHLLVLMRHMNIHVKSVEVAPHEIGISFDDIEYQMETFIITHLSARDLSVLRNGKKYRIADLEQCVSWFKTFQTKWGAGDLVRMGAIILATQICEHFSLQAAAQ
jgi:hypothetical protein